MMEPLGARFYRAFGVPWIKDDIHERLKEMSPEEIERVGRGFVPRNPVFRPLERQPLLSHEDSGSDRRQGSQVSRCHGHASESRHRRSDALRGAREFCRVFRLWAAPHAHRPSKRKSKPGFPTRRSTRCRCTFNRSSRRRIRTPSTKTRQPGRRSSSAKAAAVATRQGCTRITNSLWRPGSNRPPISQPLSTYFRFRSEPIPISR